MVGEPSGRVRKSIRRGSRMIGRVPIRLAVDFIAVMDDESSANIMRIGVANPSLVHFDLLPLSHRSVVL